MHGGYEDIFEMAAKLNLPPVPKWYDKYGCPHWQEPPKELRKYIRIITCQKCGQILTVCIVDPVYHHYEPFEPQVPDDWQYGDPPNHPGVGMWDTFHWWEKGWDVICSGVTMTSDPVKKNGTERSL